MHEKLALVLSSSLLLLLVPTAAASAEMLLRFEETAVVAEGLTAGAEVAVLGVGRERAGFLPQRISVWEVVAADGTGTARLELGRPIPTESSWAFIELGQGEAVLAAPPDTALRQVAFPGRGIPASLRTLDDARRELTVLWVRPATDGTAGAWGGAVHDGSELDGDGGQDRAVRVLLDRLEPLGASTVPPETLAEGDVLVGVDPDSLEIYAVHVGR